MCIFVKCLQNRSWFGLICVCCHLDPSPPQGLKAEVEMIGIRLTWDPPSCQVSKYQIERITDGHKDLMDSSAEETSHLISDVFPSQMYYFAIKLCCTLFDKNCESKFSNHIPCKAGGKFYICPNSFMLRNEKYTINCRFFLQIVGTKHSNFFSVLL